jgi:hypothetical protein
MHFQALEPADAEQIAELACELYADELFVHPDDIAASLLSAQAEGSNFSLGVLNNGILLGYLLAWLEESRVEGNREEVVLVEDVALSEEARPQLAGLFKAFVELLEEAECAHLPIEAALVAGTRPLFMAQKPVFARLGYDLVASHDYWEEELEQTLTWVRFERQSTEPDLQVQDQFGDGLS